MMITYQPHLHVKFALAPLARQLVWLVCCGLNGWDLGLLWLALDSPASLVGLTASGALLSVVPLGCHPEVSCWNWSLLAYLLSPTCDELEGCQCVVSRLLIVTVSWLDCSRNFYYRLTTVYQLVSITSFAEAMLGVWCLWLW